MKVFGWKDVYFKNVLLHDAQRFSACRRWRFLTQIFKRSTNVYVLTKLLYEALHRHFWQSAVMPSLFFFSRVVSVRRIVSK